MRPFWKTLAAFALSAITTSTQAEPFSDGPVASGQIVTDFWVNAGKDQVYAVGLNYKTNLGDIGRLSHGTLLITTTNGDKIEVGTPNINRKTSTALDDQQLGGFNGTLKGNDLVDLGPIYVQLPRHMPP